MEHHFTTLADHLKPKDLTTLKNIPVTRRKIEIPILQATPADFTECPYPEGSTEAVAWEINKSFYNPVPQVIKSANQRFDHLLAPHATPLQSVHP